uniref:DUF148 domain-containing protein n=1 Tax=Steinernema glaseri TaxID=37863 RepID=A0A1I7XYT3_9BILA
MKLYLFVLSVSPLLGYNTYEGDAGRVQPLVPVHHQVLALFMEQPNIDFITSLGEEELEAVKKAKLESLGQHVTNEEFSQLIGKYSKIAQGQFDLLVAENEVMRKPLVGNAKQIVEEINDSMKDIRDDFSPDDLKFWLVHISEKLRSLSPAEKESITKNLQNAGMILTSTGVLNIHNEHDAEGFMNEMMNMYGQFRHEEYV